MRGFIILCLSAVAIAAPQGYNYSQRQQQQFVPNQMPAFSSNNFQSFATNVLPVQATNGVTAAIFNNPSAGYLSPLPQQNQFQSQSIKPNFGVSSLSVNNKVSADSSSSQITTEKPKETIITKRFFIHAAPEENEDEFNEKTLTIGTPRKNYNVVFIKAPSKSGKKAAVKITQAANEDKTIIYVLSKKTDASDIEAEVQELQTTTSKPEVFFIKYKTPEEAAHAQEQIQAQYDALGGSSQVSDEGIAPVSSVIGVLGDEETQGDASGVNNVNSELNNVANVPNDSNAVSVNTVSGGVISNLSQGSASINNNVLPINYNGVNGINGLNGVNTNGYLPPSFYY